jgi:hypothetical protein
MNILFQFILLGTVSMPVHAYLGPGIGSGLVSVIIGIVLSFFLGILAILYYPIKRLIKRIMLLKASKLKSQANSIND